MPYDVIHKLINFSIIGNIVGGASPGVARWDAMGVNGQQCVAMEQL
jgi:hypothetical protein